MEFGGKKPCSDCDSKGHPIVAKPLSLICWVGPELEEGEMPVPKTVLGTFLVSFNSHCGEDLPE